MLHSLNAVGYLVMARLPLCADGGLTSQPVRHVLWALSLPLCVVFVGQLAGRDAARCRNIQKRVRERRTSGAAHHLKFNVRPSGVAEGGARQYMSGPGHHL